MRRTLKMHLPTGRRVELDYSITDEPYADDRVHDQPVFAGRLIGAIESGALRLREDGTALSIDDLLLRDFHAIRDAAIRLRVISWEAPRLACDNCEAILDAGHPPNEDIETWYRDTENELEGGVFSLGQRLRLPRGLFADTLTIHPVTVAEARRLWQSIACDRDLRLDRDVVRALGVRALGELDDLRVVARVLDRAPDEVWARLDTLFSLLNYSERSYFPLVCPSCGALHRVDIPAERECGLEPELADAILEPALGDTIFERAHGLASATDRERHEERDAAAEHASVADESPSEADARFPELPEFEQMAAEIGEAVYAARGVANIELVVEPGPASVDGAGVPLLGSYEPRRVDDLGIAPATEFVVTLYYRTFRTVHAERPFRLREEIRETIDHEVTHHLHYLRGYDPMDEEERREAVHELERTFGRERVARARRAETVANLKSVAVVLVLSAGAVGVVALLSQLLAR